MHGLPGVTNFRSRLVKHPADCQILKNILDDLNDNFAGRFSEAQPALQVLGEAVERTSSEAEALSKLMDAARNDAKFGMQSLVRESENFMARIAPTPPVAQPVAPKTSVGEMLLLSFNPRKLCHFLRLDSI